MAPAARGVKLLALWCRSDAKWRKQQNGKVKRMECRFFAGLRRTEEGGRRTEEGGRRPEGIEVPLFAVLVVWIWIKGRELRRPLKMFSSPDALCPPLGWDQFSLFQVHSLGILVRDQNRSSTELRRKASDTESSFYADFYQDLFETKEGG